MNPYNIEHISFGTSKASDYKLARAKAIFYSCIYQDYDNKLLIPSRAPVCYHKINNSYQLIHLVQQDKKLCACCKKVILSYLSQRPDLQKLDYFL